MSKLIKQANSVVVRGNVIVGELPNTSKNDIILYNKKQTEIKLIDIKPSNNKLLTEIDGIIGQWAYCLGLEIRAEDIIIVNSHIRLNFPNLNIFDLKACVQMVAVSTDLFNTNIEHYGKLSIIYISKILKNYMGYRSSVMVEVANKIEKIALEAPTIINEKERIDNMKKLLLHAKDKASSGIMYYDAGDSVFNFIKHNKLIKMSKELIEKALEHGNDVFTSSKKKKSLESVLKYNALANMKDFEFEKEDMIKKNAREYVVNVWLKKTEIEEFNKNITPEMLKY